MQHTPGPWTIDLDEERRAGQYRIDQFEAARTYLARGVDGIDAEDAANARLIEQSPAMYEFMVALRDRYNVDDRLGGLGDWLNDILAKVEAK